MSLSSEGPDPPSLPACQARRILPTKHVGKPSGVVTRQHDQGIPYSVGKAPYHHHLSAMPIY